MGSKLYVGNLSFKTTEDGLKNAFSGSGEVVKATIMNDRDTGQSRGFAFVEMANDADAQAAIRDWDGKTLDGRPLRVNEARERTERPPRSFGGGGGGGGRGGFGGELPPYVAVPRNPSFTWELGKSAFLGGRYESFKAGDPNESGYRVRDLLAPEALPQVRVERRQSFLAAVDRLAARVDGNDAIRSYDEYRSRALSMVLSPRAREAFAIDRESDAVRDRYGRTTFGQSCLLARRLVESGVRFVTVNHGGWDHHAKIFEGLDKKLPEFDVAFSALVEDLKARGLLDDTLLVCMGEIGRAHV